MQVVPLGSELRDPCQCQASSCIWLCFLASSPTTLHTRLHLHEMSRAAKLTLAGTSLGAMGIVVLVHYQQQAEKAVRGSSNPDNSQQNLSILIVT